MRTAIHSNPRWRAACCAAVLALTSTSQVPSSALAAGGPLRLSAAVSAAPTTYAGRVSEVRQAFLLAQQSRAAEREHPPAAPQGLALEWVELPTASADVVKESGSVVLRALNFDAVTYTVQATVIGDAGTMASRMRSEAVAFTLPGGGLSEIRVDAIQPVAHQWSFSGAMVVHMRACPSGESAGPRCLVAVSDPLFFHPTGGGPAMRFYGGAALANRYRSGALKGSISTTGEGAATLRVMGGGPLSVDPAIREEE